MTGGTIALKSCFHLSSCCADAPTLMRTTPSTSSEGFARPIVRSPAKSKQSNGYRFYQRWQRRCSPVERSDIRGWAPSTAARLIIHLGSASDARKYPRRAVGHVTNLNICCVKLPESALSLL